MRAAPEVAAGAAEVELTNGPKLVAFGAAAAVGPTLKLVVFAAADAPVGRIGTVTDTVSSTTSMELTIMWTLLVALTAAVARTKDEVALAVLLAGTIVRIVVVSAGTISVMVRVSSASDAEDDVALAKVRTVVVSAGIRSVTVRVSSTKSEMVLNSVVPGRGCRRVTTLGMTVIDSVRAVALTGALIAVASTGALMVVTSSTTLEIWRILVKDAVALSGTTVVISSTTLTTEPSWVSEETAAVALAAAGRAVVRPPTTLTAVPLTGVDSLAATTRVIVETTAWLATEVALASAVVNCSTAGVTWLAAPVSWLTGDGSNGI